MADRLALFTGGAFADSHAKTAHGILRYGTRELYHEFGRVLTAAQEAGELRDGVVPLKAARRFTALIDGELAEALCGHRILSSPVCLTKFAHEPGGDDRERCRTATAARRWAGCGPGSRSRRWPPCP